MDGGLISNAKAGTATVVVGWEAGESWGEAG